MSGIVLLRQLSAAETPQSGFFEIVGISTYPPTSGEVETQKAEIRTPGEKITSTSMTIRAVA